MEYSNLLVSFHAKHFKLFSRIIALHVAISLSKWNMQYEGNRFNIYRKHFDRIYTNDSIINQHGYFMISTTERWVLPNILWHISHTAVRHPSRLVYVISVFYACKIFLAEACSGWLWLLPTLRVWEDFTTQTHSRSSWSSSGLTCMIFFLFRKGRTRAAIGPSLSRFV